MDRMTSASTLLVCRRRVFIAILSLAALTLALFPALPSAQATSTLTQTGTPNTKPAFLKGDIKSATYNGTSDDLLTAGLGYTGLGQANPPGLLPADPTNPTAVELRRRAIHTNYRAIVDTAPGGGWGVLYGPTAGIANDGKIAGKEYLAFANDNNVTLMVQIPSTFDKNNPCIVTAPSSGSRGVYGAIGSAGEWGLRKGCAVAYTDKGTGMGTHDLTTDTVNLIDGTRTISATAGANSNFTAPDVTAAYKSSFPGRIAFKHAHSKANPEQDWGLYVLQSVEFAFYLLNLPENYGNADGTSAITPAGTIVIASSVSNGGAASLDAAERDTSGLIDGVAVSEPNINLPLDQDLVIRQGEATWNAPNHSRTLFDHITLFNLYMPCAVLDPAIRTTAPLNLTAALPSAANRCAGLKAAGLLTANTTDAQAAEAQKKLNDAGALPEQNLVAPSYHNGYVYESVAVTYAYAYGRFGVTDNLCGYSFAAIDASFAPVPITSTITGTIALASIFATGNGIPPTGGIQLINNNSQGGARETRNSLSTAGVADQNLAGALCLRRLATGVNEQGLPLTGAELEQHNRVMQGIREIYMNGNLHGKPTIIVHGRSDALIHPNFSSRPYVALNKLVERSRSNLRYYEVTNAHHLDAFNPFPGFNSRYIPLHHYFIKAMDLMYNHLKSGAALPPSQVVVTIPRGTNPNSTVPDISAANVPDIATTPAEANRILFNESGTAGISITATYVDTLPFVAAP